LYFDARAARLRLRFVLAIGFALGAARLRVFGMRLRVCVEVNWVYIRCSQVESVWNEVEGLC
jgi:hypothetical protein